MINWQLFESSFNSIFMQENIWFQLLNMWEFGDFAFNDFINCNLFLIIVMLSVNSILINEENNQHINPKWKYYLKI